MKCEIERMEINYTFYFFSFLRKMIKKLLTFCYWQDRKIHPRQRGCTLGCIQSAVHRQADDDGRAAFAGIGRAQNRAVLLHPGLGQVAELSCRYDLYPANPDAVPSSGPRTQRTLACAGALPYGRVRQYFLAKRHLFVGAGHHAFPRYFLLHHRAEHGAAESHVQGRLGIAGRFVRRVPLSRRYRERNPQVRFGTAGKRNHLHHQLQPKQGAQRQLQHQPPAIRARPYDPGRGAAAGQQQMYPVYPWRAPCGGFQV